MPKNEPDDVRTTEDEPPDKDEQQKFFRVASHHRYTQPEPILDATSIMEQEDRGDGMGVDDEKTYHRNEK